MTSIPKTAAFSATIACFHIYMIGLDLSFTVSDGILPNHMMLIRLPCRNKET